MPTSATYIDNNINTIINISKIFIVERMTKTFLLLQQFDSVLTYCHTCSLCCSSSILEGLHRGSLKVILIRKIASIVSKSILNGTVD